MKFDRSEMTKGPLFKNIVRYTVPIILTGILQLLFNSADLVVVGRYCGSVSLGAVGATGSLINLIINLFIGLSVGAGVMTAQALGANDEKRVHRIVHTAIPTAIVGGLLLSIVGFCFARKFLEMMATPDDVIKLSALYMRIYFCGMISSMTFNFGASILRAAGDTKSPLFYLSIAGILNVILNVFFVVTIKMDVAGVALATAISQTLSAILVLRALTRREDSTKLIFGKMKIYVPELKKIVRIGLPAGIQGSLTSISNVLIQSSINSFGSIAISGNAAAQNIEGFVYTSMNSFQQTALNFTGQNFGAGKYSRINKITLLCLVSVATTGIFAGFVAWSLGKPLLSIYITDSAEAISYGIARLSYICLPYFLCGMMDVMTGTIRGMGTSITPMLITILGLCGIRVAWIFTVFSMEKYHTLRCLYLSYPISWLITFSAELILFVTINKKKVKKANVTAGVLR